MATISQHLAAIIAGRHGIVTRNDLLADGHSVNAVRRLVQSGLLVVEHKQVYRLATSPDTFEAGAPRPVPLIQLPSSAASLPLGSGGFATSGDPTFPICSWPTTGHRSHVERCSDGQTPSPRKTLCGR